MLEATWTFSVANWVSNLGSLLEVADSFLNNSPSFWLTISNVVLSLDRRLVCRVTGNLTRGFSRDGIGLTRFPD